MCSAETLLDLQEHCFVSSDHPFARRRVATAKEKCAQAARAQPIHCKRAWQLFASLSDDRNRCAYDYLPLLSLFKCVMTRGIAGSRLDNSMKQNASSSNRCDDLHPLIAHCGSLPLFPQQGVGSRPISSATLWLEVLESCNSPPSPIIF